MRRHPTLHLIFAAAATPAAALAQLPGATLSTRIRALLLVLGISVTGLVWTGAAVAAQGGTRDGRVGFGDSLVGSAPVGVSPSLLADDPATHTLYVADGNNISGPSPGGNTVSVIDTRRCAASDVSTCEGPWPKIRVGKLPTGIAINRTTDTVYVANVGDNTVSVFNGATCNAMHTEGCRRAPGVIAVGDGPLYVFADPGNHTVYVANSGADSTGGGKPGTVSMIDSARCTASHLSACGRLTPPTVAVGADPQGIALDRRTHTIYVATYGNAPAQNGWTVLDASTCNATVHRGCRSRGKLVGDSSGPDDAAVDEANHTLYSANYDDSISAFNLHDCNAADLGGCKTDRPGIVTPFVNEGFDHSVWVAVDQRHHSVYVSFQSDDTLAVVDTHACGGARLRGCATLHPRVVHTGASPEGVVLDPRTQTVYTANEIDNDVSVISTARCNASSTRGCRHPYPSVPVHYAGPLATDDATHTAYVTAGLDSVSMINTAACNADHLAGCRRRPPSFRAGVDGTGVVVDAATHTVYIADAGKGSTGTVTAIDERSCNATDHAGCATRSTLHVPGGNPTGIALDQQTDTMYVATSVEHGTNLISVYNGATCNASDSAGCAQKPTVMTLAAAARHGQQVAIAIDQTTNTLYATNNIYANPAGDDVYVFNTAICDAQDLSGCGQTPATIKVGDNPAGLVVDPVSDTVYAVMHREGEHAASVAAIDGATCNSIDTSGCGQTPALSPAGFGIVSDAFDPATREVFTANLQDGSVSVIDGASCNATDASGCGRTPAEDAVGDYPAALAVDSPLATVYVSNSDGVSVVPITP